MGIYQHEAMMAIVTIQEADQIPGVSQDTVRRRIRREVVVWRQLGRAYAGRSFRLGKRLRPRGRN